MEKEKSKKCYVIFLTILLLLVIVFGGLLARRMINDEKVEGLYNKAYDKEIKIDASLATQPLTDAYIKGLNNFNIKADYSNTDSAYTKLINKQIDLILVTEPSKEELQRAKDKGVEFNVTPVINEGFVFYTNKKNNVDNLTLDEIKKIYTGEITNWKEVGGKDAKIIAYQRPVNSVSQTGMLSFVMNGLKMKNPTKEEYIQSMAGIIDVASNYENEEDAIGYSYYYYATIMYGNDDMKFFKVNGVAPNHDTIQNESYPIITSYYIVTLKGNNDDTINKLKEALLSKRGQKIAREAGYIELSK